MQRSLVCIVKKASLHGKQGFLAPQNECLCNANKASFYPKVTFLCHKQVLSAPKNSKNAASETLKRKFPMSKKITILRLILTFRASGRNADSPKPAPHGCKCPDKEGILTLWRK